MARFIFNARSSYASAVLGIVILSACLSFRPSVTRLLCDETTEHTADILIPHERVIIPVIRCFVCSVTGYRHVSLRNECNQPQGLATLFVHIRVTDYIPDAFAGIYHVAAL